MPGETEVVQPTVEVTEEKKEIAAEEAKAAEAAEKADEEKKEESPKKKAAEKAAKKVKAPPPPAVHKKDFEKDVVYLYQFNRSPKVPSISPYCLRVETWLKLQGIKYENVAHNGKLRSKRGLLPFVELNGEEIADSELIIKTLSKQLEKDLDEGLSAEQSTVQHAMVAMTDNSLKWAFTHWMNRDMNNAVRGYNLNLQQLMGSKMPNAILAFLMKQTYFRKVTKNLKAAGFGCYTNDEIDEMGKRDLKVLSETLGEKQFFFGDEPRTLDLKSFVWLAMILNVEAETPCPLRDYIQEECKNLVGVYNRMKDRAWADHWDEATGDKLDLNPHIPKPEPEVKEEEKKEEEKKEEGDKKEEEKKEEETKEDKDKDEGKDNKEEEKK